MNGSTAIGAGLFAGLLALAGGSTAATAAPLHHGHAAQHHVGSHLRHGKHFTLTGLVTAAHGTNLEVLVGKGRLGGKQLAKQSVSIVLSAHRNQPVAVGDTIHAQGTAGAGTGQLDASSFQVQPTDTSAIAGVIDAINGSTIWVNVSATAGSGGQGDQGDGQGDQGDGQGDQGDGQGDQGDGQGDQGSRYSADNQGGGDDVVVDVSQASVSLDGQPASLTQLATGQTVAILAQTDDDSALAIQVLAYSTAPAIVEGTLTQVNGNLLTLSAEGDNQSGTATVDVTGSQIFLDGQPGAAVSQLAPADEVLAVGTSGSDPLAATTTFAFSQGQDGQGD